MKKLKLLIAFCALMLGWSSASAQKDVTSQYITNATLSSLNGWTNVNFNTPVRGNNTTGYATECYEGWGSVEKSEYSLTQTITLPAGHYTLVNYSFFREGQAYNTDANTSRAYLKAGDNKVLVKTLGSITATGYANTQAEGADCFDSKMYRNTLDFTIDADNTAIEIGVYGTFNTEITKSWMILGMFELINNDIAATMDAPFDVTGYITNPGFEYRDMTGWTLSESGAFGTQNNSQTFKVGGYYAEKWQGSGALSARSMSQTLSNLPAGYYKLTANLGGNGTYIDLNGKTVSWTADKDYTVGYVLSENEDLVITAGKTAEGTANWIHFDNFRLQFCGDVAAALTTLIEQKTNYSGVVPNAVYTQLSSDVEAYNKNYSDVDELLAAIDAVQDLYDAADAFKAPYAAFNALKTKATALQAVENTNAGANSTLATAITTQTAAADAATTAEGIATATADLKTAMTTYVGAADPTSGNRFDLTFMLTNPDLTGLPTWQPAAGWASEETDGNSQVMVNDSKTVGDKSYFYEYWSSPAKASGKFALYNAVTLPAGTYTMSCYAFAEDQNTPQSPVNGVYFYANNTQGSCVTSTSLAEQSISFINDEAQEVKIGLKTLTGNTRNWMGIGYVELYKEYTDNTTYEINVGSVSNATVAVTVDGEAATSAKALKTVTMTFTPDAGYVVSSVTATYNDGEENIDVANPSANVYTFQMPAYNVNVAAAVVVDKSALATAISSASSARKAANEGTGVFQIPASAGATLASAITTAQGVYDNVESTVDQVESAVSTLNAAVETYEATTLNAPDAEKKYNIILTYADYAYDGKAITYIAGGRGDQGNYNIQYLAAPNANLAQAFTLTQVSGNTYTLSQTDAEGNTRYLSTGVPYSGNASQIRTTTTAGDALVVKIIATGTANVFNIYNTEANNYIGSQDAGVYTVNSHINFTIAEASQASVDITISPAVKYATRIFPFVPELPKGVKAYSCTASNGNELSLKEVASPAANVPYILEAEEGYTGTLTGWGTAATTSYTEGWLTGVYESTTATAGTYVLQNNDKVAFYLVEENEEPTVGAYRCYLTKSAGARAAFFFPGSITGVNNVAAAAEAEVKDGKYIENGKVVIVKNGKKFSATGAQMK